MVSYDTTCHYLYLLLRNLPKAQRAAHPGPCKIEKLSSKRCCSSKMENFSQLCLCRFEKDEESSGQSN